MTEEAQKYVKLAKAIEMLGESPVWVRRQVTEGKLAARKDAQGHWWVEVAAIEAKLAKPKAENNGTSSNYTPAGMKAAQLVKARAAVSQNAGVLSKEDAAVIYAFCNGLYAAEKAAWERRQAGEGTDEADEPVFVD